MHDIQPISNDIASPKRDNVELFFLLFLTHAFNSGARITVLASTQDPATGVDSHIEGLVSFTLWEPPRRNSGSDADTAPPMPEAWGLEASVVSHLGQAELSRCYTSNVDMDCNSALPQRFAVDFMGVVHKAWENIYHTRGKGEKPEDAWHLVLAGTDPNQRGKGSYRAHSQIVIGACC